MSCLSLALAVAVRSARAWSAQPRSATRNRSATTRMHTRGASLTKSSSAAPRGPTSTTGNFTLCHAYLFNTDSFGGLVFGWHQSVSQSVAATFLWSAAPSDSKKLLRMELDTTKRERAACVVTRAAVKFYWLLASVA
eukprot:2570128-Pleurochrysis_carterae.AAC.1